MKVELKADERDGCVATITGCGVGGHTATFRFEAPDYQPDPIKFDGDSVSYAREVLHGSVIASVVDDEAGEMRATLEAFSPDSDEPRRSARKSKKDDRAEEAVPRGAVTADEKEVVQEGDVAGDAQYEAAGEPGGEATAPVEPADPADVLAVKGGDGKPNS
jgi:hypothetical protein